MFQASSPAVHGGHLSTWLKAVTTPFLPKDAINLQHPEQLDTELDELMARDPNQSDYYRELARIFGSLVPILVAQAPLSERSNIAEEAWKDQAPTQSHLDQLLLETQNQREKEDDTDPELQKGVERLHNALQDLRLDTDQREHLEREARKELNKKLQQGDALLKRAETELKKKKTIKPGPAKHTCKRPKLNSTSLLCRETSSKMNFTLFTQN
ncbi:uncharacterized protein LOC127985994 [Carassius gibelio]|uniref:uncharacterized protein LOC127985994 n=1 Tax=Carassius gibelio TaxID=101364 RepID=UPI002279D9AA|nr:uncharacterized protein LOC127985994 [Carassius gibelio]